MKARGLETRRKRERGAAPRLGVAGDAEAVIGRDPAARVPEAERNRRGWPDVEPGRALLRPAPYARACRDVGLAEPGDRALDASLSVDERGGELPADIAALDIGLRAQALREP